jgi:hypothetical protein
VLAIAATPSTATNRDAAVRAVNCSDVSAPGSDDG